MFRLLQTVLFQTDSVFDAQFACFDETNDLYQWIKPWKKLYYSRHNAKTKYELVCNNTQSSDLIYYTIGSYRAFC